MSLAPTQETESQGPSNRPYVADRPDCFPKRKSLFSRLDRLVTWRIQKADHSTLEWTDEWKIDCLERTTGNVVAGLKIFRSHLKQQPTPLDWYCRCSRVVFESDTIRQQHAAALNALIESTGSLPNYIGSLSVEPAYRTLGIAPLMCQAVGAFSELNGWNHGVTFATTDYGAAKMYCRMGAVPVLGGDAEFQCTYRQDRLILLLLKPNSCPDSRIREAHEQFLNRWRQNLSGPV